MRGAHDRDHTSAVTSVTRRRLRRLRGSAAESGKVGEDDALPSGGEPAVGAEPTQRPAGGLARRPDPRREVVLAEHERDLDARAPVLAQPLGEVDEAARHAAGDVAGVAVDGPAVGVADLRGEGAQEPDRDPGMAS